MKNIKNYSVKFYHIFVVFLFVSLSFQWGFAQLVPVDGTIKLYFETVEKTKAEMDVILAGDSLIYLQVYAEFSPEFTADRLKVMAFGNSTFSWVLCSEAGALASSTSKDIILLGHTANKCPQGSQDSRDGGAALYNFAQHACPEYGHFASVGSGGQFRLHQEGVPANIVKMGPIGFKLLSSDGFFVKMASTGTTIDQSATNVVFNIVDPSGSVPWPENNGVFDWQKSNGRLDLASVGGVVVKKGFKNKSV